jgi:hypothetical protein
LRLRLRSVVLECVCVAFAFASHLRSCLLLRLRHVDFVSIASLLLDCFSLYAFQLRCVAFTEVPQIYLINPRSSSLGRRIRVYEPSVLSLQLPHKLFTAKYLLHRQGAARMSILRPEMTRLQVRISNNDTSSVPGSHFWLP